MVTSKEWFERLMRERGVTAYGAAKLIGIDPNSAYNYTGGVRAFDAYTATRVAELLGVDAVTVIASAEAERAKDAERRAYWRRLGGTAAAFFLVSLVLLGATDTPALAYPAAESAEAVCIMFNLAVAQLAQFVQVLTAAIFTLFLAFPPPIRHSPRP